MNTIVQIDKISEQGVSHPYKAYADDGCMYWCKGNHTGIASLRAEWICANIAKEMGLPIPDFAIMDLPYDLFFEWQHDQRLSVADFIVTPVNHYVFASQHVADCTDLMNLPDFPKSIQQQCAQVVLFDIKVRNTDRTFDNSNVLLLNESHEFRIIDHNNAFLRYSNEMEEIVGGHIFEKYFSKYEKDAVARFDYLFGLRITESFLDGIWDLMPEPWRDDTVSGTSLDFVKDVLLGGSR